MNLKSKLKKLKIFSAFVKKVINIVKKYLNYFAIKTLSIVIRVQSIAKKGHSIFIIYFKNLGKD